jgi:hypothetical protein
VSELLDDGFDRWPLVMLVNDAYDVVAAVRTYF